MRGHFFLWLLLIIVAPLMTPLALTPNSLSLFIRKDYHDAIAILGQPDDLNHRLVAIYNSTLETIAAGAREFRDKDNDASQFRNSGDHIGVVIAEIPGQWANMVKLQAYSLALRLAILILWLPWLLGCLLFACAAGFLERKLKAETFLSPSPPIYNTATHLLMGTFFFLVLWIGSPIPMALYFIPLIVTLFALFLSLVIANYPSY